MAAWAAVTDVLDRGESLVDEVKLGAELCELRATLARQCSALYPDELTIGRLENEIRMISSYVRALRGDRPHAPRCERLLHLLELDGRTAH